jgi:hypothetical protein
MDDYAQCGDSLAPMKPTCELRYVPAFNGLTCQTELRLQQKWKAEAMQQDGSTWVTYESWRDVPVASDT